MGGPGSTRWGEHVKATPIEACPRLDSVFVSSHEGGARITSLDRSSSVTITSIEHHNTTRVVNYLFFGAHRQARLPLVGGLPSWRCPGNHGVCGARVRYLYLPPGADRFLCRRCHRLTYRSRQEHRRRSEADRLLAGLRARLIRGVKILRRVGVPEEELRRLIAELDPVDRRPIEAAVGLRRPRTEPAPSARLSGAPRPREEEISSHSLDWVFTRG